MQKWSTTKDSQQVDASATSEKCNGKRDNATCSLVDSPASPTVSLVSAGGAEMNETCGESVFELCGGFDPNTDFSRMFRASLQASGERLGLRLRWIWKRVATKGYHFCLQPIKSRHSTSGKESGLLRDGKLWATPKASDGAEWGTPRTSGRPIEKSTHLTTQAKCYPTPSTVDGGSYFNQSKSAGAKKRPTLGAMASYNLWPTPTARAGQNPGEHGNGGQNLATVVGGKLNPQWVEWLMGYPIGWSDCEH